MSEKIWSDDPNVPYKSTKLGALYTRTEIDGLLAKWGIKRSAWDWEPEINRIYIEFQYEEEIEGRKVAPLVRVEAPVIWDYRTRNKVETVNWNISLRVMRWLIKSLLEISFLWHSAKTAAFLGYIATGKDMKQTLAQKLLTDRNLIQGLPILERDGEKRVIDV